MANNWKLFGKRYGYNFDTRGSSNIAQWLCSPENTSPQKNSDMNKYTDSQNNIYLIGCYIGSPDLATKAEVQYNDCKSRIMLNELWGDLINIKYTKINKVH